MQDADPVTGKPIARLDHTSNSSGVSALLSQDSNIARTFGTDGEGGMRYLFCLVHRSSCLCPQATQEEALFYKQDAGQPRVHTDAHVPLYGGDCGR